MSKEKTYTVTTPNPHFDGVRNGVQFTEGEGEATEAQALELVNVWGYSCDEVAADVDDKTAVPPPNDATNDELRAFMDEHEIDYESDDNKADLNDKINTWAEEEPTPE